MRVVIDDEDELLPELPDIALGDDLPFGDDELGLEGEVDLPPDEAVGLDDSTGMADDASSYALELPPEDSVTDEDGVDAIPVEGLDGDAEYGWTDDPRSRESDELPDIGLDLPSLTPLSSDDGGEEGVDDLIQLGDGDGAEHLPPLRDEDEDAGDLGLDDDLVIRTFDERAMALAPVLEPPACRIEALGGGPIACVAGGLAGGRDGLFAIRERCERVGPLQEVVSVAVDPSDPRRVLAGTPGGAFRSTDGGATFTAADGWASEGRDAAQPFFPVCESPARLWGRTAGGALLRSEDFGASWVGPLLLKPVVALVAADSGVVALCAGRNAAPQIARSEDGGQRWTATDGPPLASGGCALAALRDVVAVASDAGPFLSRDRGKTWSRLPGLPATSSIALAVEPGGLTVYTAHAVDGRALVARHRPGGGEPALVVDLESETVHALVAARADGRTVLLVASSAGLFRVLVDPDHAP